jgi:YD repeat-containing protein
LTAAFPSCFQWSTDDGSTRWPSHTDSLGNTQTFLFNLVRLENQTTDPRGFTTVYRHDMDGNLVQRRDPDGAVWDWEYDEDRNVVSEIDPFGREREFSNFDAKGNPGLVVDRDGKSIALTYNPVSGAPATILDKRGDTRTVTFTPDGLPQSTHATIGGQGPPGTLLSTTECDSNSRRPRKPGFGTVAQERLNTDGDALADTADPDDDNDGLLDVEELLLGLDPRRADTDGDSFRDNLELAAGKDGRNPLEYPLPDGDVFPLGAPDGLVDERDELLVHRILRGLVTVPSGSQTVFLRHADVAPLVSGAPAPNGAFDEADALVVTRRVRGMVPAW